MSRKPGVFGYSNLRPHAPTKKKRTKVGCFGCPTEDRIVKVTFFGTHPPQTVRVACPACGSVGLQHFLWRDPKEGEAIDARLDDIREEAA